MKYYQVANYANSFEYVNENSDISDVEKVWTTDVPWHYKPQSDDETPTPPYRFTKRSDAVRIKDALQSCRKEIFTENRRYNMFSKDRPPQWKVYTIEGTENPK